MKSKRSVMKKSLEFLQTFYRSVTSYELKLTSCEVVVVKGC